MIRCGKPCFWEHLSALSTHVRSDVNFISFCKSKWRRRATEDPQRRNAEKQRNGRGKTYSPCNPYIEIQMESMKVWFYTLSTGEEKQPPVFQNVGVAGWGLWGWFSASLAQLKNWHGIFSRRTSPSTSWGDGGTKGNGNSLSCLGSLLVHPDQQFKRGLHGWR